VKKVCYALGAAGLAPTALALMAPAAHAAAAQPSAHAQQVSGKTVSLRHSNMTAVDSCAGGTHTAKGNSRFSINY